MFAAMRIIFILTFIFILSLFSCKENPFGTLKENLNPETFCTTDTIIRFGQDRYTTNIQISWWGDDPDGFIKGFEISTDKKNWVFTTKSDSNFTVKILEGADTFNFVVYIRAIDNNNQKDLTPAYIYYPVKNSPPTVHFIYSVGNPARNPENTFPVIRFSWDATDPDGDDNIDHFELFMNDTTHKAVIVEHIFNTVVVAANDWSQNPVRCKVFQGNNMTINVSEMDGLMLDDTNQLLIRAVDKVGEKSVIAYSNKIFVRKPKSKTLLVNAYSSSVQQREDFYTSNLQSIGIINFDILRVNEVVKGAYTQLSADNTTQEMVFSLFDNIIWFGKDIDFSMSLAQKTLTTFLNTGGKIFLAVEIATSIDEQAGYLDFSPIDSLVSLPKGVNNFRIETDSLVLPLTAGWPVLKSTKISNARPFYEENTSQSLYDAKLIKTGGFGKAAWEGKSTVMAKKMNTLGQTIFIICSIELHNINGNNNIDQLFTKIFKDELGIN